VEGEGDGSFFIDDRREAHAIRHDESLAVMGGHGELSRGSLEDSSVDEGRHPVRLSVEKLNGDVLSEVVGEVLYQVLQLLDERFERFFPGALEQGLIHLPVVLNHLLQVGRATEVKVLDLVVPYPFATRALDELRNAPMPSEILFDTSI
jgi:hypothetical protein